MKIWLTDPTSSAQLELEGSPCPGDMLLSADIDGMLSIEATCIALHDGHTWVLLDDGSVKAIRETSALHHVLIADRCVEVGR